MKKIKDNDINTKDYWDQRYNNVMGSLPSAHTKTHELLHYVMVQQGIMPKSIIDIGCGNGKCIAKLGELFNVPFCGCDISETVTKHNKEKYPDGTFFVFDCNKDGLLNSYDVAVSWHTLEHVMEVKKHVSDVLEKVRYYIIVVPFKDNYRCPEHLNWFDETSFDEYDVVYKEFYDKMLSEKDLESGLIKVPVQGNLSGGILYILRGKLNDISREDS